MSTCRTGRSCCEVTIALGRLHATLHLTEKIAAAPREPQLVRRLPDGFVGKVPGTVAEDGGDGACDSPVSTVHVIVVLRRPVHVEHIAPPAASTLQSQSIALLVVFGETHVERSTEFLCCFLSDNVDNATIGIAAVECRGSSFDDFDMVDVIHRQAREVYVVHRLACETLTIYEDEHTLTAEAREVKVHHLVLGKGELHARHHLL